MVKVLIVDDDPSVAEDTSLTLMSVSKKYEPLAASGGEALLQYQANKDLGLVILDIDLNPTQEKGWQVYDTLRNAGYQGPALAMSGNEQSPEWKKRSVEFLSKAASPQELEATVNRLIDACTVSLFLHNAYKATLSS